MSLALNERSRVAASPTGEWWRSIERGQRETAICLRVVGKEEVEAAVKSDKGGRREGLWPVTEGLVQNVEVLGSDLLATPVDHCLGDEDTGSAPAESRESFSLLLRSLIPGKCRQRQLDAVIHRFRG